MLLKHFLEDYSISVLEEFKKALKTSEKAAFLKAFTDRISIIHNSLIAFFPLFHSPIISTIFFSIFLSISSSFLRKAFVEKISIKRITMPTPIAIKHVTRTIFSAVHQTISHPI